jgi:hypothetical protein
LPRGLKVRLPFVILVYSWTQTHYMSGADVTPAYRIRLRDMTGTVNLRPFTDSEDTVWEGGEVLFRGTSGRRKGSGL